MLLPSETAMPADSWPRCCWANRPKYVRRATSSPGAQTPNSPHSSLGDSAPTRAPVYRLRPDGRAHTDGPARRPARSGGTALERSAEALGARVLHGLGRLGPGVLDRSGGAGR